MPVKFGLCKGSADLIGMLTVEYPVPPRHDGSTGYMARVAKFLSIEVKRPGCKPTLEQLAWGRMVKEMGGVHIVATSIADVEQALQ